MTNYYVMPIVGDGSKHNERRPKYRDSDFPALAWSMIDYGNEPWCLVGIPNIPPATDTALQSHPDVFALPSNLDQDMGTAGNRNSVRSKLESVNIPGTWIQTTDTYRTVTRFVYAVSQFASRYQGTAANASLWFTGGVTLDSLFSALPPQVRMDTVLAAQSPWYTTTGARVFLDASIVTASNSMRTILKSLGDQYVTLGLPLQLEGAL